MARKNAQEMAREAWTLAKRQGWAIGRGQLLDIGYTSEAIDVRLGDGRLHPVFAGVYAVGRPHLERQGAFIAAVLACGPGAALSHQSAAERYGIRLPHSGPIHVSVRYPRAPRTRGVAVHRRQEFEATTHGGIAVTTITCTIVDMAARLREEEVERMVNEAANRDLIDPEALRTEVAAMRDRRGRRPVLALLDRDTFVVTDTRLEQALLPIAHRAGLPRAQAQVRREGGRVDLYYADLGLIVEADSLRFHRTAAQQRADRLRDQRHAAAGLRTLRFTHWQVFHEPDHVEAILAAVAAQPVSFAEKRTLALQ